MCSNLMQMIVKDAIFAVFIFVFDMFFCLLRLWVLYINCSFYQYNCSFYFLKNRKSTSCKGNVVSVRENQFSEWNTNTKTISKTFALEHLPHTYQTSIRAHPSHTPKHMNTHINVWDRTQWWIDGVVCVSPTHLREYLCIWVCVLGVILDFSYIKSQCRVIHLWLCSISFKCFMMLTRYPLYLKTEKQPIHIDSTR